MISVQVITPKRFSLGLERFRGHKEAKDIPVSLQIVFAGSDYLHKDRVRSLWGWDEDTVGEIPQNISTRSMLTNHEKVAFRNTAFQVAEYESRDGMSSITFQNAAGIDLDFMQRKLNEYRPGITIQGWDETAAKLRLPAQYVK